MYTYINIYTYLYINRWYIHGGCSDRSFMLPTFEYDLSTQSVVYFNEPVISLVHPYPGIYIYTRINGYMYIYI
jgi:hypothetical protein